MYYSKNEWIEEWIGTAKRLSKYNEEQDDNKGEWETERKDRQRCKKTKTKNRHNDKLVTSSSHGDNRKFYLTTKLTDLYLLVLEKSQMKWITESSFCNFESSEFVYSYTCMYLFRR